MKLSDETLFHSINQFFDPHSNPHHSNPMPMSPALLLLHLHYNFLEINDVDSKFVNVDTKYPFQSIRMYSIIS
jgi:hypothetical protein